ncbi:MAG: serine hydrolase domain-containing protein [Microcoleaceae cyanobacterium MO_207.B10]|nr:serine hydrolase domain-containing protein [Microcoleaceae cyanobacterium MO_207.B10]
MKLNQQYLLTTIILGLVYLGLAPVAKALPVAISPEEIGLSSPKLEAITEELELLVDTEQIAGGVAIVIRNGQVGYHEAVGFRDLETQDLMEIDDIFRIASNTKIMTGFGVHLLAQDGLIDLDAPVSQYIPAYADMEVLIPGTSEDPNDFTTVPAENQITIRQLLNHTSGIDYNINNNLYIRPLLQEAGITDGYSTTPGTIGEAMDKLADIPLAFEPGSGWNYALNSDLLGYLIEVASEQTLAEFFEARIFDPLEMEDTSFFVPDEKLDRLTTSYTPENDGLRPISEETEDLFGLDVDRGYPYITGDTYFSGGAGLTSTVDDYSRFLQMLLNQGQLTSKDGQTVVQIAEAETVENFLSVQPEDLEVSPFYQEFFGMAGYRFTNGMAVKVAPSDTLASIGAFKWAGLYNTHYFADPEEELIGVVMTQLFPYLQTNLSNNFESLTYNALCDDCQAAPVPEPTSILSLLALGTLGAALSIKVKTNHW